MFYLNPDIYDYKIDDAALQCHLPQGRVIFNNGGPLPPDTTYGKSIAVKKGYRYMVFNRTDNNLYSLNKKYRPWISGDIEFEELKGFDIVHDIPSDLLAKTKIQYGDLDEQGRPGYIDISVKGIRLDYNFQTYNLLIVHGQAYLGHFIASEINHSRFIVM